jgi:DeoR family fructose operon transcriptional repressor
LPPGRPPPQAIPRWPPISRHSTPRSNFELAFCSAAGLTLDAGLTTSRRALADVINVACANAARSIGLIDSNKFGRASLLSIAQAQELDVIVTDDGLDERTAQEYRAAGVRLDIVRT